MAARQAVKVAGLRQLGEAMRSLGNETATKIARSMTNAGAKLVRDSARQKAPEADAPHELEGVTVQPGNLKKNIVTKRAKDPSLTSVHIVTVRGKKKDGYAARYGRLQEFGTVNHPPQPFLRPAFDELKMAAVEAMKKTGERRIAAAAKKAAKKK